MRISVIRKPIRFSPDFRRVILRYFDLNPDRVISLIEKIIPLTEEEAQGALNSTLRDFAKRHRSITRKFLENYGRVKAIADARNIEHDDLSMTKKLLIGSFFSLEYSIESAAFFNPSVLESPDQTGLEEGCKRIIVSFRATGEGHISSLVFRSGIIDKEKNLNFLPVNRYVEEPEIVKRHVYQKNDFINKLREMNVTEEHILLVMNRLGDQFIYGELLNAVDGILNEKHSYDSERKRSISEIVWLAESHYEIEFSKDTEISERVIFPISYSERKGIEDARFVKFIEDDGRTLYYGTYTAYDGHTVIPKLIETRDFYNFKIRPLHGVGAQNKNLALFPRKIKGRYAMLSRIDGINSYVGLSENINIWDAPILIQTPQSFWEYIQIGNCGSPIETKEGWLIITHGVGPMRQYSLGASLFDLDDPTKQIARLSEPLLAPNEEEREGYVPNVVYSCGSIIHDGFLLLPYAMADTQSAFALVNVEELLAKLREKK